METNRSSSLSKRTSAIYPTSNRNSSVVSEHRSSSISTDTKGHKLVLITGATGAIGKATAVAFAQTGKYNLALHYNSASEAVRDKLLSSIGDVLPAVIDVALFQADLSNFDGVKKLHREVAEGFGKGVDILFNNAGSTGEKMGVANLGEVGIEVFERTWRINAASPILLTQLCLPWMEKAEWGRVIFNSSIAAFNGGTVGPHYASSKSAIHGFVHWLGQNVAKKGITVNAVAPALIEGAAMLGDVNTPEMQTRIAEKLPVGRLGRPEEIAETVMWMVNTGYVTRKIVPVDGGYHPY